MGIIYVKTWAKAWKDIKASHNLGIQGSVLVSLSPRQPEYCMLQLFSCTEYTCLLMSFLLFRKPDIAPSEVKVPCYPKNTGPVSCTMLGRERRARCAPNYRRQTWGGCHIMSQTNISCLHGASVLSSFALRVDVRLEQGREAGPCPEEFRKLGGFLLGSYSMPKPSQPSLMANCSILCTSS